LLSQPGGGQMHHFLDGGVLSSGNGSGVGSFSLRPASTTMDLIADI
jgi:hypothetical protein